jgi:hypothetical protein
VRRTISGKYFFGDLQTTRIAFGHSKNHEQTSDNSTTFTHENKTRIEKWEILMQTILGKLQKTEDKLCIWRSWWSSSVQCTSPHTKKKYHINFHIGAPDVTRTIWNLLEFKHWAFFFQFPQLWGVCSVLWWSWGRLYSENCCCCKLKHPTVAKQFEIK